MIDVEDIIGKRAYRVGMPVEDIFSRIEEELCGDPIIADESIWSIVFEVERFHSYKYNLTHQYIILNSSPYDSTEKKEKIMQKYYEDGYALSHEVLNSLRDDLAYSLDVIITNVNELGCTCEAKCESALYEKLSKGLLDEDDVSYFAIENAKSKCMTFLDQIFIGILKGNAIEEIIKEKYKVELLINDHGTREISDVMDVLLDEATTEVLICGWMGTHYLPKLIQLSLQGVNIKIMTHKPGEAKGQPWKSEIEEAYRTICSEFGLENISNAHNIHGRTLVVDNKAIIGSMDLNSSSLTGAHTEFAILTDDPDIVRRMRAVFNTKFQPLSTAD